MRPDGAASQHIGRRPKHQKIEEKRSVHSLLASVTHLAMAICKRSTSFVCLAALMVVMATVMLSCDAGAGDWCEGIPEGCVEWKCQVLCLNRNLPKEGARCLKEGDQCCCSLSASNPEAEAVVARD
uniref:Uncharacterized protein n=1 Tax=Avena sativa TaxID=4498 RepID=A0ACD5ZPU1_AVESA